uniref:Protein FAR1-RELATED SEQUENCE n=1 Tax=Cannabis sativa TaxID=3483 RepID=A0A803NR52_CANSA
MQNMQKENNEGNNSSVIKAPESGMHFSSFNDLYEYYREYGKQEGFGIKKKTIRASEDRKIRFLTLSCSRAGKSESHKQNFLNPNPLTRVECKARINGTILEDGKSGGHENVPFLEKDCRNLIEKARRLRLGVGDAEAIHKYFVQMQSKNSSFFYMMDLDDKSRIKNVFWADARSRAMYEEFGDVVTFDTTYLTNKHDMPFVPFIGVNHHGILCKHAISILIRMGVSNVPMKYILSRWKKNIRRCHRKIKLIYDDLHSNPISQRYHELQKKFDKLTDWAIVSDEKFKRLWNVIHEFEINLAQEEVDCVPDFTITQDYPTMSSHEEMINESNKPRSPIAVRRHVRPPKNRKVPMVEKLIIKEKKAKGQKLKNERKSKGYKHGTKLYA